MDEPTPDIPILEATPEQLFVRLKELHALAKAAQAEGPKGPARRVWDVLEVREKIIGMVDRRTQGRMMRLHKGATASVASKLYREVHVNVLRNMSRAIVSTLRLEILSALSRS